jgi:two-component system chemotaxis response regulator CheY
MKPAAPVTSQSEFFEERDSIGSVVAEIAGVVIPRADRYTWSRMKLEEVSVLIVEDVLAMRLRLKDLCREIGFRQITITANGEEARVVLSLDEVHLVLVDWYTEPLSGMDLLLEIRKNPKLASCGFVMVTAENTREKVIEALKAGVDDYMVKPIAAAQLQSKVMSVLMKRKVIE